MSVQFFLGVLNSNVFSFFLKKFVKHNQDVEINDLRVMPLVMPTPAQSAHVENLAKLAIQAKLHGFASEPPGNALVAECREIAQQLERAPAYLRAGAQAVTYQNPDDCLQVVEQAVNWEAEKLYGVEGLGPFDEF
jgi:hypothetical protein